MSNTHRTTPLWNPPVSRWSGGFWTSDGETYVFNDRAFDIATGDAQKLPPFPGWFLCFSPDRRLIVSYDMVYEGVLAGQIIKVSQTDLATGAVVTETVPRAAAPWLADSTHGVPGTLESYNLWQAAHLKWKKDSHGHDRPDLPK